MLSCPALLDGILLNLGHPEALRWLIEHTAKVITEQGIDLYRQDFNMDPLEHWRRADDPDRQGMTENLYVQGYLTFWGELRRRFPVVPRDGEADIAGFQKRLAAGENPRNIKVELAKDIITLYHSRAAADEAAAEFDRVFRDKQVPDQMPESESEGVMRQANAIIEIAFDIVKLFTGVKLD
jgi:hypothetical protein